MLRICPSLNLSDAAATINGGHARRANTVRIGFEPPNFAKFEALWGPQRIEKLMQNVIQTPLIDISSTEIRDRLAASRDVTDMLHPAVADYIRKHGLYQSTK